MGTTIERFEDILQLPAEDVFTDLLDRTAGIFGFLRSAPIDFSPRQTVIETDRPINHYRNYAAALIDQRRTRRTLDQRTWVANDRVRP